MKKIIAITLALLIYPMVTLSSGEESKLHVAVSILPQKYFVDKIGGNHVSVTVIVPKGSSPATYEPRPSQMVELGKCPVWFAIGVPFERTRLAGIVSSVPSLRVIHTEKNVKMYPMGNGNKKEDSHIEIHDHAYDPHVWLSPSNVMLQARVIALELSRIDTLHKNVYMENYIHFIAELADLDRAILENFSNHKTRAFLTFHPSWGYFARDYGLEQITIESEGKEPSPKEMGEILKTVKSKKISTVFVEPQFSKTAAETIAKTVGAQVEELDPLAEDWDYNLRKVASAIEKVLN